MENHKKILFLFRFEPYNLLLEELTRTLHVTCLQYKDISFPRHLSRVEVKTVDYFTFGIAPLVNKLFRKQVTIPLGVKAFVEVVGNIKPDYVVTADFFHWSFLQAVAYKKKHPEIKLLLLSETKAIPQNKLSKVFFNFFLKNLKRNIKYVDFILTPTTQAKDFYSAHFPQSKAIVIAPSVGP